MSTRLAVPPRPCPRGARGDGAVARAGSRRAPFVEIGGCQACGQPIDWDTYRVTAQATWCYACYREFRRLREAV